MKPAEQFLEECRAKWAENKPENAKDAMIEALIAYASQAIDDCAKVGSITAGLCDSLSEIDNAILSVKTKLK